MTQSCDPSTGVCEIAPAPGESTRQVNPQEIAVIYVGDPMCSWCWGVSPAVVEIERFCADRQVGFSLRVGGLRPGGGDPWNASFRSFLRHEWQVIQQRTGQPFGFQLLDRATYDYDTEPACCAVVAVRTMTQERRNANATLVSFFAAVQKKFYTQGQDPCDIQFYRELCEQHEIDFDQFQATARSRATLQATHQDYAQVRQWGVRGFPTFLLQAHGRISAIQSGYTTAQQLKDAVAGAAHI
ncbi:MAG: DsbA family protein [Pseudomonadota bacterium]|nr:DsbA family protein [Pseudomonadota bacterium]